MPIQPDSHITAEHARFINEVELLEMADTGDLYPYVRQAGYHGSRNDQYALGRPNDYSIRLAADQLGPADKTAGFDWISESARLHGDHTVMYRYGRRIRAAYNARDPRLTGWREFLTYLDGQLIGFDFTGWYTRVPDSSHGMHHHMSKLRGYTTHWQSYAAMLSILAGESLSIWQSGQSRYQQEAPDMTPDESILMKGDAWRTDALIKDLDNVSNSPGAQAVGVANEPNLAKKARVDMEQRLTVKIDALGEAVEDLASRPQVQPAPIDPATLKAALLDPEVMAVLVAAAEQGANAAEDS